MNKYSDIEIQTAENLLKRDYKWLRRDNLTGTLYAYEIEPMGAPQYVVGKVICSDLVPIFESIRCGDTSTSIESIVHPQILDEYKPDVKNRLNEWVSMKHESPDDGEQVLILTKYRDIYVGKYLMAEGLFKLNTCGTVKVKRVTHWMKLPAMPKGEPDDET